MIYLQIFIYFEKIQNEINQYEKMIAEHKKDKERINTINQRRIDYGLMSGTDNFQFFSWSILLLLILAGMIHIARK